MSLSRPQLVLFDLDGTLVDTAPDLAWSVDATLSDLGIETCGEQRVREWIGSGIESLLHRALTSDFNGRASDSLHQQALGIFMDYYFDNVCRLSRIYDGVEAALNYLESENIARGCVTNKTTRFTDKLLKELGLYNEFGIIVSGDTLEVKKPDPAPLLHAAAHFDIPVAESLMVGDSITDVSAARNAGMPVVGVPYGYNQGRDISKEEPDLVVDNLHALVTLF